MAQGNSLKADEKEGGRGEEEKREQWGVNLICMQYLHV
jgi:hypothetical protein